ncbi:MAG: pilus assembly protein PilM [Candidatus Omnitrophota bacterium]
MSILGINFGHKLITAVELKGKKVLNTLRLQESSILGDELSGELKAKVPDEIKIVALFNDELRRTKIEANEASIALSGKDLIIRTFDMPYMPQGELNSAIKFEIKKYIPFKVEDLVFDFQVQFDRAARKYLVLFVAIKKETLNKYLSILNQLSIKANAFEYSAFSVLRFLRLAGVNCGGITAVLSVDLVEESGANLIVLDNGFPLFDRDITLSAPGEEAGKVEDGGAVLPMEKLKTEMRISLDYYYRKYPGKKIKKVCLLSSAECRLDLEAYFKEIGLPTYYLETKKFIAKDSPFSLGFIRSYGCGLSKAIKTNLKIDLLSMRARVTQSKDAKASTFSLGESIALFRGTKPDARVLIAGVLICAAFYGLAVYRKQPIRNELNKIISTRPKVTSVNADASYSELSAKGGEYKQKFETMNALINKQVYFTEPLKILPQVIPNGIWLVNFSFSKSDRVNELSLQGFSYLGDSNKEISAVHVFYYRLKKDPVFSRYFSDINILSLEQATAGEVTATRFAISCRGRNS